MMALPFVLLVGAGLAAVLGFRTVSIWIWVAALATMLYALRHHATGVLNVAL